MLSAQSLIDFTFCLGLLTVLVACYGSLRRRLPGTTLAPQVLGLLFGAVAVLQMHLPIRPFDGVVVDLRVVPIVLAGAFLGMRGMLIAVAMATAMRLWIGGGGWFAGIASIWAAGGIGLAWAFATVGPAHRSTRGILALGAAACTTLSAAALLPADIALWFMRSAAPWLAGVYMLTVPFLALLLERQRVAMQCEAWERATGMAAPDPGFETSEGLTLALARAEGAGRFRDGVAVLSLRVRSARLALSLWGAGVEVAVLRALQARLRAALPPGAEMGMIRHGEILVLLEPEAGEDAEAVLARLRAETAGTPFAIPGMAAVRLHLDGRAVAFDWLPSWREIDAAFDPAPARAAQPRRQRPDRDETVARLFDVSDRLLEACAAERNAGLAMPRR